MTETIATPWSRLQRSLRDLITLIACATAITILVTVSPRTPGPSVEADGGNQGDDQPAGGVTVEARVTDIWLPQTLADVARRELPSLADPGQDGLRRRLERRPVPRLFYAFTVRTLQVNGGVSTLTFLRGSPSEAIDLDQFLDVLATAAGRPPVRPGVDYTGATLHVLPSATSQRELLEAIRASNLQSVP